MICVSISHISQLAGIIHAHPGLIELRIDLIGKDPQEIYAQIPDEVRTIATCRPGKYGENKRISLLNSCMDLGASFIDVEVETSKKSFSGLINYAGKYATGLIVSYHNFERTPGRKKLEEVLASCYKSGGIIAKIATHVNSMEDTRNLLALYDKPGKKVVIGMGRKGRITRIMAPYLGAEFTFASPDLGVGTAPGQLSLDQLNEIYKVINKS